MRGQFSFGVENIPTLGTQYWFILVHVVLQIHMMSKQKKVRFNSSVAVRESIYHNLDVAPDFHLHW